MNIPEFQQNIGETAECIKGINNSGKGCGQLSSNDTLFSDSLFRGVKKTGGEKCRGGILLRACEYKSKGILPIYVGKVIERVDGRVSSCYEECSNSSWQ